MEEDEKAQRQATENAGRGGQTKMVVAVEIPRRREVSTRPNTGEEEDSVQRMGDAEVTRATIGVNSS